MLAASDRREIPVFTAAYKELCTRIWIELELLAQVDGGPRRDLAIATEILRLELVVLVDSCRSPHWSRLLTAQQRDRLCSMLTDVLAALYVDSEHLRPGIAEAQDRVLDELMPGPECGPLQTDPACADEIGRGSVPAVNELVSLIEAQAAARALRKASQLR